MQFKTITNRKLPFFVVLGLLTVLTSCGSFQYAGYDNDGIYNADENENVQEPVVTTSTDESNYYKNYFAENSAELDAFTEESEIFTDIDSYEGNYIERAQDTLEQRPIYGGWGQVSDNVTINIIDNGWGWNNYWGWNAGWGWNNWGWGRPWGWNNWGWNAGWGWNNWGWNAGWGWGWNNWGWNAWCPPGYYNGWAWNNGFYRNNRLAFNNSRRVASLYGNNSLSRRTRSNAALSRGNYSTRRLSSAVRNSRNGRIRNSSGTTSRRLGTARTSRSSRSIRNNPSSRSSSSRMSRSSRSSRSSGNVGSSRSSRSSGSMRSSRSSSSRSSGSMRSSRSSSSRSSGSMRSSGSSRSSSGGRRGRG